MPKKKTTSVFQKIRTHLLQRKFSYMLVLGLLLLSIPFFITRENWTYIRRYGIRLPMHYDLHGIDVSHHNDSIDWQKLKTTHSGKTPISFCFIKATEGGTLKDVDFQYNWKEAQKANFVRGAYHFYVPMTNPELQAQNFIESVNLVKGDFAPVLDFEHEGKTQKMRQNLKANIRIWLTIIEKHYGVKPIIYTNKFIYLTYIKGEFDDYPLWISDYDSHRLEGYGGANLLFWQHSTDGRIDGIKEKVDFNAYIGSKKNFDTLRL